MEERIRALEDALIEMIGGGDRHLYQGGCPDAVEGPWSRDPECPACQDLVKILDHRKPNGQ